MNEVLLISKALICAAICLRLFCYSWPDGSRYRFVVTGLAYVLTACTGAISIFLVLGKQAMAQLFDAVIYAWILFLVFSARGNLAKILEIRHG